MTAQINRRSAVKTIGAVAVGSVSAPTVAAAKGKGRGGGKTEDWPMPEYNPGYTAFAPDNTGPTSDPEIAWKSELDFPSRESVAVVNGTLYAITQDGRVYTIDANTGQSTQLTTLPEAYGNSGPTVQRRTIYVGHGDAVYALDSDNGNVQWSTEVGPVGSFPVTVASGSVYAVTNEDPGISVHALNAATGKTQWSFDTGKKYARDAIPTYARGQLHVGTGGLPYRTDAKVSTIFTLNANNGDVNWKQDFPDTELEKYAGSPVVSDGSAFAGVRFNLYGLDARKGDELWSYRTDGDVGSYESTLPAVGHGKVIGAQDYGNVVAVNRENGDLEWIVDLHEYFDIHYNSADLSPVIAGETVYVATTYQESENSPSKGLLVAFDIENGQVKWSWQFDNRIQSMPVVADGKIFVSTLPEIGSPPPWDFGFPVYALEDP